MNTSRYILQYILINKNVDKLVDSISWIMNNHPTIKIKTIDENDKYYKLPQKEESKEYFPIMRETVNKELGIDFVYYSNNIFPKLDHLKY